MNKVKQQFLFLFLLSFSTLSAQSIQKLLVEKRWLTYDNFAIIDFQKNGKAVLEYAYCSYCKGNMDTLDWSISNKILVIGSDSLRVQKTSKSEIITFQYGHEFIFKTLNKIKKSKLKKEDLNQFLITEQTLVIYENGKKFGKSLDVKIHFSNNSKMWMGELKYRGQWALKSFYGSLFLIYVNRYSINRDFPLIKLISLKKKKLIGKPIPSVTKGSPFVLEIIRRDY